MTHQASVSSGGLSRKPLPETGWMAQALRRFFITLLEIEPMGKWYHSVGENRGQVSR